MLADLLAGVLATLAGAIGLAVAYRSHRRLVRPIALLSAAALLAAGAWRLSVVLGAPTGVPVWIGLLGLFGFVLTLTGALAVGVDAKEERRIVRAAAPTVTGGSLRLFLALGSGAVASVVLALGLSAVVAAEPTEWALLAVLLWPVVATAVVLYLHAAEHRGHAYFNVAGLSLLVGSCAVAAFVG